jgi:uridine kinase
LTLKQADHAHDAATELEGLVLLMPSEKSRPLAQLQVKASHKQAREFRELAQQILWQYKNAGLPATRQYVLPGKGYADLVFDSDADLATVEKNLYDAIVEKRSLAAAQQSSVGQKVR